MLDSTKVNELATQCGNEVYSEVKICFNFAGLTSKIVLLFLESSKQFSHYYGLGIIFIFHTLSLLGILVSIEGEIYLAVLIFLY